MNISIEPTAQQLIGIEYAVSLHNEPLKQQHDALQANLSPQQQTSFTPISNEEYLQAVISKAADSWFEQYVNNRLSLPENDALIRAVAALSDDKLAEVKALVAGELEK